MSKTKNEKKVKKGDSGIWLPKKEEDPYYCNFICSTA